MKLELENVGKLEKVDIELNGITVIAGENNTGKSTVGKMLFSIFHTFFKIEEKIKQERVRSINKVIRDIDDETDRRLYNKIRQAQFAQEVIDSRDSFLADARLIEKELERYYFTKENQADEGKVIESLEGAANKIYTLLSFTDVQIMDIILQNGLYGEFGKRIGHVNTPEKVSRVCLTIKDKAIEFVISGNSEVSIKRYISLSKEIIYIDDPFVLDELDNRMLYKVNIRAKHRRHLLGKLIDAEKDNSEISVLEELLVKEKIKNILAAMDDVCDGELIENDNRSGYSYKTGKLPESLELSNLSTGLKAFVIIRTLLQNGSIDDNGVIILDEPEIHLHPQWQLKFAEIIVLLQKEFGIHILLNTHSPYFLNAIEVYADKHQISGKCKYYMTEEEGARSKVIDVTDNLEKIYERLARPLQVLENLGYKDGSTI